VVSQTKHSWLLDLSRRKESTRIVIVGSSYHFLLLQVSCVCIVAIWYSGRNMHDGTLFVKMGK
jgi:hypothetical protein